MINRRKTLTLELALYDPEDIFNVTGQANSLNHNFEILDAQINSILNDIPESGTGTGGGTGTGAVSTFSRFFAINSRNQLCMIKPDTPSDIFEHLNQSVLDVFY